MSLLGALNVGQSALAVAQAAIQTTGNNIANAGNANYARETTTITPAGDSELQPGVFIGNGVDLSSVQRQVDESLNGQLNSAISDNSAAAHIGALSPNWTRSPDRIGPTSKPVPIAPLVVPSAWLRVDGVLCSAA